MKQRTKVTRGGERLRRWLRDERRTQKWLAEQIGRGAHQTYVSRWILGESLPGVEMALAVRRITGISVEAWTEPVEQESGPDVAVAVARAS